MSLESALVWSVRASQSSSPAPRMIGHRSDRPAGDLAGVLRAHGIQVTAQRIAVMRAVARQPHVTADGVVESVRLDIGSISRQAVYDTLAVLMAAGLIRRIQPVGSPARFEDRVADNHHHLICRACGHLVDVDCAVGAAPCLAAADDHGFDIDEAEVAYWGYCPDCRDDQPRRASGIIRTAPGRMAPPRMAPRDIDPSPRTPQGEGSS